MLRIGLTGGIGSGKSTVSALFATLGVPVLDCDVIARELTQGGAPAYQAILDHFGPDILCLDNSLDRRKLRELIFNNPAQKQWLEKLLHPLIRQEIKTRLASLDAPYALIVVPLLSEAQGIDYIDRTCVVDCSEDLQRQRLQARDPSSAGIVEAMLQSQHSREQRLQRADDVIKNEGDLQNLKTQVEALHHKYLA